MPDHGFTSTALTRGARDAGLLDISPAVLPDGPFSLIRWHLVTQREALKGKGEELFDQEEGGRKMGVGKRVRALTWERLMGNKDVNHRWQEVTSQPSVVSMSFRTLANH